MALQLWRKADVTVTDLPGNEIEIVAVLQGKTYRQRMIVPEKYALLFDLPRLNFYVIDLSVVEISPESIVIDTYSYPQS